MRVKVTASTNKIGSASSTTIEVDDEDLEDCSEKLRDEIIEEQAREAMWNLVDWDWEILE